jgi:hypothetical protein
MSSRKQSALISHKRNKIVEKSILLSKVIQLKLDFDMKVSCWVPRAQANKPMPQVNLTFSVSYDDIRLGCNDTQEIIDAMVEIVAFLSKNMEVLDANVAEQQDKWLKLSEEQFLSTKKPKVVKMSKVG